MANSTTSLTSSEEAMGLARDMAGAYGEMVAFYRQRMGLSASEADAKARQVLPAVVQERISADPTQGFSWVDVGRLMESQPEAVLAAWEGLKDAARQDLASGRRAALALEVSSGPRLMADFLAIREALISQWRPAGGTDLILVDIMAQAYACHLYWIARLQLMAEIEVRRSSQTATTENRWQPPQVSEFEAVEQAGAMVDRFNRLFLRTLRALRDLRRYNVGVVIGRAGQVNIGDRQVNIEGAGGPSDAS